MCFGLVTFDFCVHTLLWLLFSISLFGTHCAHFNFIFALLFPYFFIYLLTHQCLLQLPVLFVLLFFSYNFLFLAAAKHAVLERKHNNNNKVKNIKLFNFIFKIIYFITNSLNNK